MRIELCDLEHARRVSSDQPICGVFDAARGNRLERYLIAGSGDMIEGAMLIRPDAFDSEVLSAQVGRAALALQQQTIGPALVSAGTNLARDAGYDYLLAQVDARAWPEVWAFSSQGFRLVDVGVQLEHDLRHLPPLSDSGAPIIDDATDGDVEAMLEKCATIFRGSRFYTDSFYGDDRADELHRRWIRNCYQGRAERFLVARIDDETVGFIACILDRSGDVGTIDLLGVAPGHRRTGVGSRLVAVALRWFGENAKRVSVKSQATNYAATSIYETAGFRLRAAHLGFSKVLDEH
jgi:GNAT superfamily N-acetyltransferase